jgi:hypothetical protein
MLTMLGYFLIAPAAWNGLVARPDLPVLVAIWAGNFLILVIKHRADLAQPPRLQQRTPRP